MYIKYRFSIRRHYKSTAVITNINREEPVSTVVKIPRICLQITTFFLFFDTNKIHFYTRICFMMINIILL